MTTLSTPDPLSTYFTNRMEYTQTLSDMALRQSKPVPASANPQEHGANRVLAALKEAFKRKNDIVLEHETAENSLHFRIILDDGNNKSASRFSIDYIDNNLSHITTSNVHDGVGIKSSGTHLNLRLPEHQRALMDMISDDFQLSVRSNALNATGCKIVLAKGFKITP